MTKTLIKPFLAGELGSGDVGSALFAGLLSIAALVALFGIGSTVFGFFSNLTETLSGIGGRIAR